MSRAPHPPRLGRTHRAPAPLPDVSVERTSNAFVMDLTELMVMLRRNVRLVLAITVSVVLLVVWLLQYEQPAYQSTAALRLADARIALSGGFEQAQMEGDTDPFLSELEVLRSRSLAGEVVDAEGLRLQVLDGPPDVYRVLQDVRAAANLPPDTLELMFAATGVRLSSPHWTVRGTYGTPLASPEGRLTLTVLESIGPGAVTLEVVPKDVAVEQLIDNLIVSPRATTNIVDIHYTAADPGVARRVLDRIVTTFQMTNAERAQQQSRRRREFLEAQITRTDSILTDRQLALSQFRGRAALYSTRDRMQAEQASLTDVELRRRELTAEASMYRSLLARLDSAGASGTDERLRAMLGAPRITNPILDELYAQLLEYQREHDALTTGRWASSATHPDVQRLSSLIASTEGRITDAIASHIASVEARIGALGDVEARSARTSQSLPQTEAEEVRLVQQVETVRQMGDQLREEYQRAQVAEAVEVGQVEILDAATLPLETSNLSRTLKLSFALLVGLILGCGGAVVRELLDPTVRRFGETTTSFDLPQLAVIPRIESLDPSSSSRTWLPAGRLLPSLHRPPTSVASRARILPPAGTAPADEAFRSLRTNLMFAAHGEGVRTLVVTSAFPQEGKSVTASRLARAFAQQGVRTLLVDGDLRRPMLHMLFDVPQKPGLTEVLRGSPLNLDSIRSATTPNLYVLAAGALPADPAELLAGERMRTLVNDVPDGIDLLILDSPPLLSAADASALSAKADAVLLVVRAGRTARGALRQAVDQLEAVGARIVGAVLNDPETKVARYADHYDAYGYYVANGEAAVATEAS